MPLTATPAADSLSPVAPTVPERAIVFFDGVCGLCDRSVTFLLDRDRAGRLLFAPLQGETAARLLEGDIREKLNTLVLRTPEGRCYLRSSAAVRILWTLGGGWAVLGALLWIIPRPLRNLGYRLVAASRYRLFGRHDSCRMPNVDDQSRLLP